MLIVSKHYFTSRWHALWDSKIRHRLSFKMHSRPWEMGFVADSHATRLAGTENFKTAYGPDFPVVSIVEAHPGRVMTREQLETMGLLAAPEAESAKSKVATAPRRTGPSDYRPQKNKAWPNYAISLAGAPRNHSGNGPDRSMADFTWCMTAIDWRWPIEETVAKLSEVSEKARERVQMGDEGSPLINAQNAAAAVERNALKRGQG